MGVRLTIDGKDYEAVTYTVREDSTPTSSDDSSGSVGQITFDLVGVEHPFLLEGKEVSLKDTRRGTTVGTVTQVQETDYDKVSVSCLTRLGKLNIYDVQAQPFHGTLRDAFLYYASLAEQVVDVAIDEQIATRQVVFPGWYGELWYFLKQMAAAQDCEITLVSGVILLRPLRSREIIRHRDIERGRRYGGQSLARAVEVYQYNNRVIENKLVYPPEGWTPETEVITVGAGETTEMVLELSASVTYIQPPVMQTFVSQEYSSSSVYTIVGDDGLPIVPSQWTASGGRLEVSINPDTTSLTVTVTGAEGIRGIKGDIISSYSVALGADYTGNRYSTLRLIGTGVAFNKEKIRVRTCVKDQLTGTDVGITIDNPFLSTANDAWAAGVKAARWFAGEKMDLSGTVSAVNQIGDSGSAAYPKYSFDQSEHQGKTYGQVQSENAGKTYETIRQAYYELVQSDFNNQVFGNVNGARVWDRKTLRWYRTRGATVGPGPITFEAEDDLLHDDVEGKYGSITYQDEEAFFTGRTYSERDRLGLLGDVASAVGGLSYPSLGTYPSLALFPSS